MIARGNLRPSASDDLLQHVSDWIVSARACEPKMAWLKQRGAAREHVQRACLPTRVVAVVHFPPAPTQAAASVYPSTRIGMAVPHSIHGPELITPTDENGGR